MTTSATEWLTLPDGIYQKGKILAVQETSNLFWFSIKIGEHDLEIVIFGFVVFCQRHLSEYLG